ncbi:MULTISPECIES: ATP-binding cassette domain-containing protein [Thalassospira]|jgi:branched-chain amino acid transport system ATP-binding protein|uniref:ABC transporter ATP-binding protein n=1 Tax=Thalassospira TaxID=168934 RepID=UPI000796E8A0|nr:MULTISPECIES: ATP-binding cassette domain-containing protein [Thalassospira]KXJ56621.1 MAG: ABC transporter ATP-binding protein [Thalassospira sp. Nap_22]MBR9901372.1 ATP-binding cassette domain-containing protein [Rhodospirillales bacterium]KZC98431.1 ABC transporter ATP-binding protein [Thalassospira sp. MCCC 1A02898]MBO6578541.1 ATP-binding cassette domain-containing protein [Thalassospira sp.]MBO6805275.1 ATP-binding cassette domain-containing protein [Thalassospira sp.]|tara:strand:+ start:690 stop:1352 length:663 start_codon:yes stop_codon:yes gene_type:complete
MTLEISNLDVSIGNIPILRDVSLSVPSGKMFGLIGHNGAGKTTLMRAIMGLLDADQGTITFDGQDLRKMADFARAKAGISYMPEDRRLIPSLTVEENILLPAWTNGIADAAERLKWVYDLLPEIAQFRDRRALQLSGGQQKLVSLGRALMPGRNLLLLDEPFEGVAPVLSRRLSEVISDLGSSGLCVLISESDDSHSADLVAGSYRIERGTVSKAELETA